MRYSVRVAKGRRDPVPRSKPTYEVDLTRSEMEQIEHALAARIRDCSSVYHHQRSVNALAMIQMALRGRY